MRTALLLLLFTPALALAQAGRFLLAVGDVTLVRGTQQIRAATGHAVEPGDLIRVGARSSVQLRMSDQSIISLRSNTEFRIDEYSFTGRGDDSDRSVFSLLKGGMRTVGGAIARQLDPAFVKTAAQPQQPSEPQPAAPERKPRDESERKALGAVSAPLRAVAGALTPTRHAVNVPTATIGIRGTHYTLVHCNNDCFDRRRTSVASLLLAQSDAPASGLGNAAPNGTYGGISDGLVGVTNKRDDKEFGANQFFYVPSADSAIQSLIGPPGFLYDKLEAQERNRGQPANETTANMGSSGLNAESRPSDPPVPPAPPQFVVTEQRSEAGDLTVVPGDPTIITPRPVLPSTAFLSAFTNANSGPSTVGAFVDSSALTDRDIGDGIVLVTGFNVPAGSTANPATGAYSGSAANVQPIGSSFALGARWGRWLDGSAIDATGTTAFSSSNFFHYLVGPNTPPEVIAGKTGSANFDLLPGTFAASNNVGEAGVISGTRFVVDFTARTLAFPASSFSFGSSGQNWTFAAPNNPSPISIDPARGAWAQSSVIGTCAGGSCTTLSNATLSRTAIFMGPAGGHLGMSFNARTTGGTGTGNMNGTGLFNCVSGSC